MTGVLCQLVVNGLVTGALYALAGLGFSLKYRITHFFDFAHGALVAVGAYGCWVAIITFRKEIVSVLSAEFWIAAFTGVLAAAALGWILGRYVYQPLWQGQAARLGALIASLGVYVVIQNLISLLAGDDPKVIRPGQAELGISLWQMGESGAVRISGTQLTVLCVTITIVLFYSIVVNNTLFGKEIRALANDEELARIRGMDVDRLRGRVHGIGGALAGIAGILWGLDTDLIPGMGFPIMAMVMASMVVGGINSSIGVLVGGFVVGVARSVGAIAVGTAWQDAAMFAVMVIFLVFRPNGIVGS